MLKENVNAKIKFMNLGYVIIFLKEKGCQHHSLSHVRVCSLQGGLSDQGQAYLGIFIALEAFLKSHVID